MFFASICSSFCLLYIPSLFVLAPYDSDVRTSPLTVSRVVYAIVWLCSGITSARNRNVKERRNQTS